MGGGRDGGRFFFKGGRKRYTYNMIALYFLGGDWPGWALLAEADRRTGEGGGGGRDRTG